MAENAQSSPHHSLPHSAPSQPLTWFSGQKVALALGIGAAAAAALFVYAPWSFGVVAAVSVFALAAVESEPLLLFVIFLIPVGWAVRTGGQLHDVAGAMRSLVVAGFFLGRMWRGVIDLRELLRSSLSRVSLLFVGAIIAPAIFARGVWTDSYQHGLSRMVTYVGFFFLISAWADSPERIRKILRVLLCSTIITAGFAIFQEIAGEYTSLWLYLNPPGENFAPWQWRATSFLNYSNSLAGYLNLVLPFAVACFALGAKTWKKLGAWTVGLGFLAMLCTQSVGGLIALAIVLVLAIFCFVGNWHKRWILLAGFLAIAFGLYLAKEILNPSHAGSSVGYDAATRLLLWDTAWNLFTHNPIAGVGWGNFVALYGDYLRATWIPTEVFDVHNIYLQLLAETGVPGFALFFSLMFLAGRKAWRQFRSALGTLDRALAFGVFGAILTILIHGFVDFLFRVSAPFGTLYWLLLALLVANARVAGTSGLHTPVHFELAPPFRYLDGARGSGRMSKGGV